MVFSIVGGVIALMIAIGRFMTSELDSDSQFLYLGLGSAALVLASYAFVEVQHRRHGALSIVHDYVLGFGHLFAALGTFWITRWILFASCGQLLADSGFCHGASGAEGWMPAEWGVLLQAGAFVTLGLLQWMHNRRVGATTLPRLVSVLAPLIILMIGSVIWLDWSDGTIGKPLILSVVLLTGVGMWLGSTSDRAPLFLASAGLSSVIPIIYEATAGGGAGLSLLALVVLMQGVFASAKGLSRSMIQVGSIALVVLVVIAEFTALVNGYDVVLATTVGAPLLTLPLFLWLALLIGYFLPVHMRRVPWMPIGLAVGLSFIPSPGSALAWALALIAFTYMLTRPQTRRWVSDWTYAMLAASWFLVDWLSSFGSPFDVLSLDPLFLIVPPAALLLLGEVGSNNNRLSKGPHHLAVALILLSHEMLFGDGALLPLCFVAYLTLLVARTAINAEGIAKDDTTKRREISVLVLLTGAAILLLQLFGRLDSGFGEMIGVEDLGIEALFLAVILYGLGRHLRSLEYDVGHVLGGFLGSGIEVQGWDPKTATWSVTSSPLANRMKEATWGPAMRFSLILPLMIFSAASSQLNESWAVFLLLIPIMVLMREVLFELPKDNRTRAAGAWLLFLSALPWSLRIHEQILTGDPTALLLPQIAFDVILLSGPLLGHFMLMKEGVEREEGGAAGWLLAGLMMTALLDTSGGLLLFSLLAIVFARAIRHRRQVGINLLPFAFGFGVAFLGLLPHTIVDLAPTIDFLVAEKHSLLFYLKLPVWAGLGFILLGLVPLTLFMKDHRNRAGATDSPNEEMPLVVPVFSLIVGLHLLVSEPHLLLFAVVLLAGVGAWFTGKLSIYWVWSPLFAASLTFVAIEENFWGSNPLPEAAAVTVFACWLIHLAFWRGVMETHAVPALSGKPPFGSVDVKAEYAQTRKLISNSQLLYVLFFSLLAVSVWGGIAFLVSAFGISCRAWVRREKWLLMGGSILEAFAIGNSVDKLWDVDWALEAVGAWLVMCGLVYTWASWRNWDFEWREISDAEVVKLSRDVGIGGAVMVPFGALMLSQDPGLWLFGGVLSLFGGFQMLIGFERDEGWRRIYTLISIPTGIIIVASDIENGVMQGVMYLLAALTLFGQGFLYMNRAEVKMAGTGVTYESAETSDFQSGFTEPVGQTVAAAATSVVAPLDTLDAPYPDITEPSVGDAVAAEVAPSGDIPTPVTEMPEAQPPAPAPPTPDRFDSGEGFMVELPADVMARLRDALATSQFEGFQPVVRWDQHGQVILDFEPE